MTNGNLFQPLCCNTWQPHLAQNKRTKVVQRLRLRPLFWAKSHFYLGLARKSYCLFDGKILRNFLHSAQSQAFQVCFFAQCSPSFHFAPQIATLSQYSLLTSPCFLKCSACLFLVKPLSYPSIPFSQTTVARSQVLLSF